MFYQPIIKLEKNIVKKKYLTAGRLCCTLAQVTGMEKIVRQGQLYDFYGELLTEHQKKIYEDVVFNDLSLSEIAAEQGISRQGVHDLVKRCDKLLEGYEEKLHLVEKFQQTKAMVEEIRKLTQEYQRTEDRELLKHIDSLTGHIIEL